MAQSIPEPKGPHVLIIGAGITGLLLAQGLKKNGISYSIFEAEESATFIRPREWGMPIQWALPMLEDLLPDSVLSKLQSTSVMPHYVFPDSGNTMPVYNAETGERMKDIPLVEMIRVSRRKMRALCAEGIDIKYGKEFRTVRRIEKSSKITAHFLDGTSATGDMIIAADGANSAVRSSVFPAGTGKAQQIPYGGVNMHVRYENADIACFLQGFLSPVLALGMHPNGYWLWLSVQDVPDPERPETWTFQLQWTWRIEQNTACLSELEPNQLKKEAARTFEEPFRTAWTSIPDDTRVTSNNISVWSPMPIPEDVYHGKIALLGDAAHPMSFHRGQGLNHGIADAAELSKALSAVQREDTGLVDAVASYEANMIKRAGEEVRISKMNTEMVHDWERLQNSPFMERGADKNN